MRLFFLTVLLQFAIIKGFSQVGFTQDGNASSYPDKFEGRTTASGESYSFRKATCSHLTLPFGSLVKVTNLVNNLSVVVRVNDRGPFVPDRIIDISKSAAEKLGFSKAGTVKVKIEVIEDPIQSVNTITSSTKEVNSTLQVSTQNKNSNVKSTNEQEDQVESELYELKVNLVPPKGFAIQIGSYKELVNMLRIANEIKSSLKKEIRVQVITINSEKVYRLFVGNFSSRKEAENFKVKAAKIYPDCFIAEL